MLIDPAGQAVGDVIADEGQYDPAEQVVGVVIAVDGQYDPTGHG